MDSKFVIMADIKTIVFESLHVQVKYLSGNKTTRTPEDQRISSFYFLFDTLYIP